MAENNKLQTTREKILSSGEDLFSKYWYETVSIAQVCRNAKVSNGIYYKYFSIKEDLFKELLNKTLRIFDEEIKKITGKNQSLRLRSFLNTVVSIGKENRNLITIFREGQYKFPEFENKLEAIYKEAINNIFDSKITDARYFFIMSGIRFISIRSMYNDREFNIKTVQKIIEHGIFKDILSKRDLIFSNKILIKKSITESDTKTKLLNSAIALFGKNGFHNVNVYEISRNANLSVGSFYIHFKSKDICLEEIVELIGIRTRNFISSNLSRDFNRLDQEIRGMHLFLEYFKQDSNYYRIVRQSEFVVNEAATNYYNYFEKGYLKNLKNLRVNDKTTVANFLMGLSHYLGIEVFFTGKIKNTKTFILELSEYLQNGITNKI